jgi:hypothetical protein
LSFELSWWDGVWAEMEVEGMEVVGAEKSLTTNGARQGAAVESLSASEIADEKILSLLVNDLPWIEKYRPKSLSELIAHEEIVNICQSFFPTCLQFKPHVFVVNRLIENNQLPHLLFHGPPGTGKTSTIIACAKKMFGEKYQSMVLELNASDDRGFDLFFLRILNSR